MFILSAVGCSPKNYVTFSGFEQGTTYNIVVRDPDEGLGRRIDAVFDTVDNTFSMFNPASLVSRINRNETDRVTPLFEKCFDIAQDVWRQSDGYYDITVKPLVDAWGFGPGEQQEIPCVECLMEFVGMEKVRIENGIITKDDPRLQLDFSSVAKGLTVDLLAELIESEGVTDYMVYVGGEVRARGKNAAGRPWRIGIDRPSFGLAHGIEAVVTFGDKDSGESSGGGNVGKNTGGVASGKRSGESAGGRVGEQTSGRAGERVGRDAGNGLTAIATSGNYRNWFTDAAGNTRVHTLDPKTGTPAVGSILSVSIMAAECGVADAWATALMAARELPAVREILPPTGIEYYIIYSADRHSGGDDINRESPGRANDAEFEVLCSPGVPVADE